MAEALEMGYLVWAVIVTIFAVGFVVVIIYLQRKHHNELQNIQQLNELSVKKAEEKLESILQLQGRAAEEKLESILQLNKINLKRTKALGISSIKGDMTEILASFKLLTEYEQLALFHSVSKQFSIDLMGIKKDSVDFIEVKSTVNKLSDLSKKEQSVKKLIDEKKVRYRIIEGKFPDFEIKEKELD